MTPCGRATLSVLGFSLCGALGSAQEPLFMEAATHPGRGQVYTRLILSHGQYRESSKEVEEGIALGKASYGIRSDLATLVDVEMRAVRAEEDEDRTGLSQVTARLKYRFLRRDLGPLDTWRASLQGGVAIPGIRQVGSPDRPYTRWGAVTTAILGRHGINAQADWAWHTDDPDTLDLNASYLYRLAPAEYSMSTRGAWYLMLESLNRVVEGGGYRSETAGGLLYEARRWAAEAGVRAPLAEHGPIERDPTIAMGVRYLW